MVALGVLGGTVWPRKSGVSPLGGKTAGFSAVAPHTPELVALVVNDTQASSHATVQQLGSWMHTLTQHGVR